LYSAYKSKESVGA